MIYTFQDASLLEQALTHTSVSSKGQGKHFERLEFLGDRVLGLAMAAMLHVEFPTENEGQLARRFSELVRRETLVRVAYAMGLDKKLKVSREKTVNRKKSFEKALADCCEAYLAAVYLDGGFEAAQLVVQQYWTPLLSEDLSPPQDAKSALQEWAQAHGKGHPVYHVIETSGPAHAPHFIIEVRIDGVEPLQGTGSSKREAEQSVAQLLLEKVNI